MSDTFDKDDLTLDTLDQNEVELLLLLVGAELEQEGTDHLYPLQRKLEAIIDKKIKARTADWNQHHPVAPADSC